MLEWLALGYFGFLYSKLCCPEALACGASHTSAKAASGFSEPVISGIYLCSPVRRAGGASDPMKKRQPGIFKPFMSENDPSRGPVRGMYAMRGHVGIRTNAQGAGTSIYVIYL